MTIQTIIDLLKKDGIGSKQLVIKILEDLTIGDFLDGLTYAELKKLERDVKTRAVLMRGEENEQ